MIKFFRKIRQRLLSENKFTKYLLYALGEIVLVVAGILIALQLNIYQENRKKEAIEIDYLKGILTELDQDIYELNDLIFADSLQLNAYTMLLRAFKDSAVRNNPKLIKAIGGANTFHSFTGNNTVFEDLKSSGKTNYIKSDDLRISMLKFYKESQNVITVQRESSNPQLRDLASKAFLTNLDLNSLIERHMFPPKWSAELDDIDLSFFARDITSTEVQHFGNYLSMMKAITSLNNSQNEELLYSAEALKSKILLHLDKRNVVVKNVIPANVLDAIKNGNTKELDQLVSNETLNTCYFMEFESGNYLVHCITYQSLESLKFFVEKGADIECICEYKTPLMYAIKYGEFEMVKYLVEQGADITANNHGKTPLYYARNYKHPEIEAYLLEIIAK